MTELETDLKDLVIDLVDALETLLDVVETNRDTYKQVSLAKHFIEIAKLKGLTL